ncbi:MAG: transposase, partial [Dermatophilaceae bacterium]
RLQAISLDLGGAYQKATNTKVPHVRQCADPFHVIKLANEAIDKTRRVAWNQARQTPPVKRARGRPHKDAPAPPRDQSRWVKHSRWALVKDPDHLKPSQLEVLHELRRTNSVLYRCWQLNEAR